MTSVTERDAGAVPGSGPLDLLLVEDNPGDARLIREYLSEVPGLRFDLTRVRTRSEAVEYLADADDFDLVFLDLDLPDSAGLETVRPVTEVAPHIPIVVLTGREEVRVASDALAEGCQDYLVKAKVGPEDLTRAIRTALERERVERELRESEERFRQMAESIGEVFYLMDLTTEPRRQLYVSPAFEEIFDMPVERLYEDPDAWLERVHPEDRDRVRDALGDVSEGEYEARYRIRRPGGEVRWVHARTFPVVGDRDSQDRVAGVVRDVTEEMRLRHGLEEERAQLQQIIDEAPAFMALYMGPELVLERANEAWYELVGDRDALGKPVREIFPELQGSEQLERLEHVYETGESLHFDRERFEVRDESGQGTATSFLNIAYQPRIGDGEVVGVIVHGVDVTGLVRAHREVKEREQDLEAILETAAEGIVFTDAEGCIRYANPAAERIMGLDTAEITDRGYADPEWAVRNLAGGEISDRDLPVARALRDGERVQGEEITIGRPDGARAVLSVSAVPLCRDGDGSTPQGAVASFRDVTDRKELERELRHRALHDHMTGLPNRALFRDRLEQALGRAERTGEGFALLFLDLKRFKVINDNLGHGAGDRVLAEVGSRLQTVVRMQDTVARVGGDEFTVLLTDIAGQNEARRGAERVAGALDRPVELGDGHDVPVEATIGVAVCLDRETAEAATPSALVRRADDAMYEVKDRVGTAYAVATPAEQLGGPGRVEQERELRDALDAGDIRTAYQPVYDLESGEVGGVEALARWTRPGGETISPARFIPLAEETGLIVRLGQQQLANACRELLAAERGEGEGGERVRLHVNLSARQLVDPNVVGRVREVLESTGFPAGRLTLEITETAAMREPAAVDELRKLGARIAIDDFGTEHSSLAQVKELAVDALKVDRSFVSGLPDDPEDRAIVETVLTLARSLDLGVVSEGVETEAQLEALREAGCRRAQGFLLSEPVGPEGLGDLLS